MFDHKALRDAIREADEVLAEWVKLGWARQRDSAPFVYDFTPEAPTE